MGHPDYCYQPWSDERREAASRLLRMPHSLPKFIHPEPCNKCSGPRSLFSRFLCRPCNLEKLRQSHAKAEKFIDRHEPVPCVICRRLTAPTTKKQYTWVFDFLGGRLCKGCIQSFTWTMDKLTEYRWPRDQDLREKLVVAWMCKLVSRQMRRAK